MYSLLATGGLSDVKRQDRDGECWDDDKYHGVIGSSCDRHTNEIPGFSAGMEMTFMKEDHPQHPSMAAISYEQLLEVEALAREEFGWRYHSRSMRDVVESIIIPHQDLENGKSYALTKNPQGLKVGAFITHCWDEHFADFVESIRDGFRSYPTGTKPNLWICAFALLQGDHQVTHDQIGESLDDCPFVLALRSASWFVVVRNAQMDLYSRIWCVCELMYAKEEGFTTDNTGKTMVIGPNKFSHLQTSCREAEAYDPLDKKRILATLDQHHGKVEEIDRLVQRYRNHDTLERVGSSGFQRTRNVLLWTSAICFWIITHVVYSSPRLVKLCDKLQVHIQNGNTNRITRFHYEYQNLGGTICTEIGLFTNLVLLKLENNHFTGLIPTELGLLTQLSDLTLNSNKLSGTVPTELARLTWLTKLNVDSNNLTGQIPKDMGALPLLEYLGLDSNKLTGPIPAELGTISALTDLFLDQNELMGTIPPHLGNLAHVQNLGLGSNNLNGSIPTELGRLSRLSSLWLFNCGLTGPIPTELGLLTTLSHRLVLERNSLSGTIPSQLGLLTNLRDLTLHGNKLIGTIPSELFGMSSLTYVKLYKNSLTGKSPVDVCFMANFTIFCDSEGFSCGGKCIC